MFAQYIDEIDHPRVGIHFDIGNHIRISPPAALDRVLGKRIKKLDVKDRTKANERMLIGEGEADWSEVRLALHESDTEVGQRPKFPAVTRIDWPMCSIG